MDREQSLNLRELVASLSAKRHDAVVLEFVQLVKILLDDFRLRNDNATVRGVFRNQGAISVLTEILDYISHGVPEVIVSETQRKKTS